MLYLPTYICETFSGHFSLSQSLHLVGLDQYPLWYPKSIGLFLSFILLNFHLKTKATLFYLFYIICPLFPNFSNCSTLSILYQIFQLKLAYSKTFKPITSIMNLTVRYVLRSLSILRRAVLWSLECFLSRQKKQVVIWHWVPPWNNVMGSNSWINVGASIYDSQIRAHQICRWRDFCQTPFCAIQRHEEKESINQQYALNSSGIIALKKALQELCQVLRDRGL